MDKEFKRVIILQYAAVYACTLVMLSFSTYINWSSPALIYLTSNQSRSQLVPEDFDVFSTAVTLGCFLGFFLNIFIVKCFGTKWAILIFVIPQIASWILLIVNEDFTLILISRFLSGLGYSGSSSALIQYVTAVTNFGNRGTFLSTLNLFKELGSLVPFTLSNFFTYFQMNFVLTIIPVIFFVIFIFMPQSSYFEELNRWKEEVIKINTGDFNVDYGFNTFRTTKKEFIDTDDYILGKQPAINFDLKKYNILNTIKTKEEDKTHKKKIIHVLDERNLILYPKQQTNYNYNVGKLDPNYIKLDIPKSYNKDVIENVQIKTFKKGVQVLKSLLRCVKESDFVQLLTQQSNRKVLLILMCLCIMNIFGGHLTIVLYTQQFLNYPGSKVDTANATFFLMGAKIIGATFATQIIQKIEKKALLLFCGIISSISFFLTSLFFFLNNIQYDVSSIHWFPVVFITLSEIVNVVGVQNVYSTFQAELIPDDLKTTGICVTNIMFNVFQLLVLMKFQRIINYFDRYVIFGFFGLICLSTSLIVFIIAPKTRGKTLQEIQNELKK